jgi:general secretion pathway protein L
LDPKKPLTASIDRAGDGSGPLARRLLEQTRGSQIEIVVPDTAILENQLEPLPGESRPYVGNVVLHRIETLFPWRAAETLFATEVTDRSDGRLDINVRATSRSAIAPALDVALACGAGQVDIIRDGEQDLEARKVIPAFVGRQSQRRLERARLIARYAVFGLVLLTVAVAGDALFAQSALRSDIAALDQTIAERRDALQLRPDRQTALRVLESKKREGTIAVVVLEELSKILPNDTYLTDLTLDRGQLRIAGVSAHATDLVALLEGTGHYKNASFYAPTTRQEGMDHFNIETSVKPILASEQ